MKKISCVKIFKKNCIFRESVLYYNGSWTESGLPSLLKKQKGVQPLSGLLNKIMAKNRQKSNKGISCLGALLILCMLLIAALTGAVNWLFRTGNVPKLFSHYYLYYAADDMGETVPAGSFVIAEETKQISTQEIVLYRDRQNDCRIAVASLIVDSSSTEEEQTAKTYYLTTMTNATAVEVSEDAILGICRNKSSGIGWMIRELTSTYGLVVGLVLPCVILFLYLISAIVRGRDTEPDFDDEDTDLAFVKSIQQKQQKIAERDAERLAKERKKTQTFDDAFYDDPNAAPSARERMSDEEIAKLEEEEAARRAERIAAVRTHMEQRRQTETPDGVPLYTTEIITKTHTLSLPKTGDQKLTNAEKPLKPTPTEDIPRLTATGHIQIPSAEQLEKEKKAHEAQEDRLRHAAELARAAQDAAFGDVSPRRQKEEPAAPVRKAETVEEILNGGQPAPEPVRKAPAAETSAPAAQTPAAKTVKKTVKKVVKKQQIKSSDFGDLMAFLDNEQKKL